MLCWQSSCLRALAGIATTATVTANTKMARLSTEHVQWPHFTALVITTVAGLVAAALSPSPTWRRIYVAWSIALACIAFIARAINSVMLLLSFGL